MNNHFCCVVSSVRMPVSCILMGEARKDSRAIGNRWECYILRRRGGDRLGGFWCDCGRATWRCDGIGACVPGHRCRWFDMLTCQRLDTIVEF